MSNRESLFVLELPGQPRLEVVEVPYDTPRGNRLALRVDGAQPIALLEGHARHLHLALRSWVRRQKALRGDTPRGRAKLERRAAQEATDAPAAR